EGGVLRICGVSSGIDECAADRLVRCELEVRFHSAFFEIALRQALQARPHVAGRFEFGNRLAGVELPVHSPAAAGAGALFRMIAIDHCETVSEERDGGGVKGQPGGGVRRVCVRTWIGGVAWILVGAWVL